MTEHLNILLYLLCFLVFAILQAYFINGVKASMDEGMILEGYLKWVKRTFNSFWQKPLGTCLRCMASTGSAVTFWPTALWIFGYNHWMIPIFMADVFIVLIISWLIYKNV
jgi:hypothetical protein